MSKARNLVKLIEKKEISIIKVKKDQFLVVSGEKTSKSFSKDELLDILADNNIILSQKQLTELEKEGDLDLSVNDIKRLGLK